MSAISNLATMEDRLHGAGDGQAGRALKYHREKLIKFDKRNRSVLLRKIHIKHNFDLEELDDVSKKVLAAIFKKKKSVKLLLDSKEGDMHDAIRAKLQKLSNNMEQLEEETGQQTGYLGFPFLQGHISDDFYIRGPLVLFPVTLRRSRESANPGWYLDISSSQPVYNGAIVSAVKKIGKIDVGNKAEEGFESIMDTMDEYTGSDPVQEFMQLVSVWARDIFGRDLSGIVDPSRLPSIRVSEIKAVEPLVITDHRIIGSFPQADSEIYADYGRIINSMDAGELGPMGDLLGIDMEAGEDAGAGPAEYKPVDLDTTPDRSLNTIIASDSSQDEVILEAKRSPVVVVRGPPGTGKSQVITNIISDGLSNGKKVLVVCQKRAALDVVHQRLGKVGLDKFVVVLGKESSDRKAMYEQLLNIMEDPGDYMMNQKTSLKQLSNEIDTCVGRLAELGSALHKEYYGGISAFRIYTMLDSDHMPAGLLHGYDIKFDWTNLEAFTKIVNALKDGYLRYDVPIHPWFGRLAFTEYGNAKRAEMDAVLAEAIAALEKSTMTRSPKIQAELEHQMDIYLNKGGFLNLKRKAAAKEIARITGAGEVTKQMVEEMHPRVRDGINAWGHVNRVLDLYGPAGRSKLTGMVTGNLVGRLREARNTLPDFDTIRSYDIQKSEAGDDIIKVLENCRAKLERGDDWGKRVKNDALSTWLDAIEAENPVLRKDPVEVYNANRAELVSLYEAKKIVLLNHIRAAIAGAITGRQLKSRATTQEKKDWKELAKQLKRKRKVKPIRQLFKEYYHQMFKIAPCWLASPESVSKIFPSIRGLFDIVVIDEASQLQVERSLPVTYRGKSVVIAGDEKQLQPFDLFQIREEDEEEDDEEILTERSLLDAARTLHSPIQLAWHYRSRYQDLINFSNHAFYSGLLQIAPNVSTDPEDPPVRWVQCNGIWDGRANHAEAEKVLEIIEETWKKAPDPSRAPSIGIITFNDTQRDLIHGMFNKKLDDDHEFYRLYTSAVEGKKIDERPFFKNIENVQGDERDIIIFSTGYAKDGEGRFANRFGTLSMAGGENRLNVAITRSRRGMTVVTSIDPSDIKETSRNDGPRLLRKFLEYARATSSGNKPAVDDILSVLGSSVGTTRDTGTTESPFEDQVRAALESHGYEVHPQVGISGYRIDLGVVHPDDPNRYIIGVECDGAMFHSAKSVKERDVMRQKFLEGKGWTIERIWSRRWWKNPTAEIQAIRDKIEKLRKEPPREIGDPGKTDGPDIRAAAPRKKVEWSDAVDALLYN